MAIIIAITERAQNSLNKSKNLIIKYFIASLYQDIYLTYTKTTELPITAKFKTTLIM